jgi:PilZ domain-containing protein
MQGFNQPPKPGPLEAGSMSAERIALCERCEFEIAGSGNPREGVVWNVSAIGLYLVVQDDIPPMDAAVQLSLWLPGDPRPLRAAAQVVWRNPPSTLKGCGAKTFRFPPGCGLRFVDITPADLARIQARVESVHTSKTDTQRDPRRG